MSLQKTASCPKKQEATTVNGILSTQVGSGQRLAFVDEH